MGVTKNSVLHTRRENNFMKKLRKLDIDFSIHAMESFYFEPA